jgi:two-component system nitrogen regulation response regulator GlnG
VQVKLLRVLEHNEVLPVGGNQPQPINVRILSATHQDLQKKIAEGLFRHDLYFRLNVFQIHLPPLRERAEDIVALSEHFLRRLEPRALPLLPETVKFLGGQPWFGNVRELRNALEHAVIVARGGPLRPENLPPPGGAEGAGGGDGLTAAVRAWLAERVRRGQPELPTNLYGDLLREIESALLEDVIKRVQGNRWVAAQWLGLNRATVRKKLGLYGLAGADKAGEDEAE